MLQLNLPSCNLTDFLIAAVSSMWLMDKLTNNAVTLNDGGESRTFIKLVYTSGAPPYNPPPGYADTLIDNLDGTFKIKNPQQLTWNFGTDNNLATFVDPAGVTVTYTYSSGKLQTISNGLGRTLTFNYTGTRLTSVSDGNGRSVSFTVDSNKNLTAFTDATSKTITYSYTSGIPGQLSQIFLPANASTAFLTNTFDSLGRVMTQALANAGTTTMYFAGSRSEIVDPLNNSTVRYFNYLGSVIKDINALNQITNYAFDGINRLTTITYPELNTLALVYDNYNNILSKTWQAKPGSSLSNITNTFTYNSTWNKVATAVDGVGNTTSFTYSSTQGTLLTITRPTIGGSTPTVTFTYNTRGQALTRTDETGMVDAFVYSSTNETLTSATRDYGSGRLNLVTAFGYDSVGNVNSVTDPRGNATTFSFDAERRLTQRTECSPFNYVTNWDYDYNSNLTSMQRQTGDVSQPYQTWNYIYLANNMLETITDPANNELNFVYNNNLWLTSQTNAEGQEWQFSYDDLGRILTVTDPMLHITETRTYTNNGMLASIQDVRSYTTTMEYDGFDRLSKTIYPDNSYEQYSYNANNQVLTARTRNADTITNTYDVLTRLATRQPGSSLGLQTLSYDLANRLIQVSTPVISGDPATGNFQFGFDTAGRLITQTMPDSKVITYQLDGNSNRTKLTWPDNYYADYVFDKLNRLTDIKLNGASTSAIQLAYDPLSRRTSLTYENGSSCAYSYYINNDLATLAKTFVGSSVTFNFDYNKIHQVIGATCTDSNYIWTPAVDNTVSYATANNLNQYPAVGGTNYSYNNNGCVTAGLITASYDALNRVTQAVSGSNTNNYWTDPLNRQIQKSVNGTKTLFLNDGLQQIASYNGSGSLTNRFIPGINLDELFISISGSSKTYLHSDRLGSLIAESNSSGTVMNKFAFSPFGESYAVSGTGFGYTGQRFDQEINSYYYRARYYSPSIGRFWQPDPIGFAGGMNFYAYVGNDTINWIDPLGLDPSDGRSQGVQNRDIAKKFKNWLRSGAYAREFQRVGSQLTNSISPFGAGIYLGYGAGAGIPGIAGNGFQGAIGIGALVNPTGITPTAWESFGLDMQLGPWSAQNKGGFVYGAGAGMSLGGWFTNTDDMGKIAGPSHGVSLSVGPLDLQGTWQSGGTIGVAVGNSFGTSTPLYSGYDTVTISLPK